MATDDVAGRSWELVGVGQMDAPFACEAFMVIFISGHEREDKGGDDLGLDYVRDAKRLVGAGWWRDRRVDVRLKGRATHCEAEADSKDRLSDHEPAVSHIH